MSALSPTLSRRAREPERSRFYLANNPTNPRNPSAIRSSE